jgi:hypothetical protein
MEDGRALRERSVVGRLLALRSYIPPQVYPAAHTCAAQNRGPTGECPVFPNLVYATHSILSVLALQEHTTVDNSRLRLVTHKVLGPGPCGYQAQTFVASCPLRPGPKGRPCNAELRRNHLLRLSEKPWKHP